MKNILFTGVSSFTGFNFVKKMSENKNFNIFCVLTRNKKNYSFLQKKRIEIIKKKKNVHLLYNCKFGDENFIKLLKEKKFKILCFHHSYTKNYNDDFKFDFSKSLVNNLNNIENVFKEILKNSKVIISNTYSQSSLKNKAFSKYGISKNITYETFKNFCNLYKIEYKSIFINNPWGILEEKKLNYYLISCWLEKKEAIIKNPYYIRDNINIDILSSIYNKMILSNSSKKEYYPSGYCCSNRVFCEALRQDFEKFFKIVTRVKYLTKQINDEPIVLTNKAKILKKVKFQNKDNIAQYFSYYGNLKEKKGFDKI